MSRLLQRTMGWVVPGTIATVTVLATANISSLYLRNPPDGVWLAAAAVGLLCAVVGPIGSKHIAWLPPFGWLIWTVLGVSWSESPSATIHAVAWHLLYFAAFVSAARWPRTSLLFFSGAGLWLLAAGVDILLVTESEHFTGIWYNKNVQGAHLLLTVPFVAYVTFHRFRGSPYLGLILGALLFYSTLTRAMAPQILLAVGLIAVVVAQYRTWIASKTRVGLLATALCIAGGFGLAWSTIQPSSVQLFGVGVGGEGSERLTKSNTDSSLLHRVEMIGYGLSAGAEAFPHGTGAGTTRSLYPGLKRQPGVNVPDLHNYYAQAFMTQGLVGVALFAATILTSLYLMWRARLWSAFVAVFLFAGYLSFDVAGYFPALMMLFFATMGSGVGLAGSRPDRVVTREVTTSWAGVLRTAVIIVALAIPSAWIWWVQPCDRVDCLLGRKLGERVTAQAIIAELDGEDATEVASSVLAKQPRILWAHELLASTAERVNDMELELAVRRETASRFPYAHAGVYASLRDAALSAGLDAEAERAENRGRELYPRAFSEREE